MDISLNGKTAVVCGSSQGIGLAVAQELAGLGATCILLARNEQTLKDALARLPAAHQQRHAYRVADFSQPEQVSMAAEEISRATDVHILVNNTGGPAAGPIIEADENAFLSAFNQHIICNQLLVKAFFPAMRSAGYGRIINIVSTSVKIPLLNLGVSNTIRGAVASWARSMANELGEYGITVNNVLPGFTDTQRLSSLMEGNAKRSGKPVEDIRQAMLREIPLKRFAKPAETAALAAFLASPAAAYITGTSIRVDGGRTGSI
ncbi:MAG: SDR family oxidoreductase [Chitinophagaceae bacterium]|nr:SDR family oxidoreductase [Chitinophagaceae bacterium]